MDDAEQTQFMWGQFDPKDGDPVVATDEGGDIWNGEELKQDTHGLLEVMTDDDRERLRWLEALEAAGVDNWEGIDHAADIYRTFTK